MSRRRRAERRLVRPEPKYNSQEIARFINKVMMGGKKTRAQQLVYGALQQVEQDTKREALGVFSQALKNATPLLQVKPRRVGGATYQVPTELSSNRSEALGMRWIIRAARARKGMSMTRKLALEFVEASRGEGTAVRRREELHRMADANRAFAHYKW